MAQTSPEDLEGKELGGNQEGPGIQLRVRCPARMNEANTAKVKSPEQGGGWEGEDGQHAHWGWESRVQTPV